MRESSGMGFRAGTAIVAGTGVTRKELISAVEKTPYPGR